MKILVVKLSALGDILETTPLISTLAKKHEVFFLTFSKNKVLVQNNPDIKKIFVLEDFDSKIRIPLVLINNILTLFSILFQRIDVSILLHKIYILNRFFKFIGIKRRMGLIKESGKSFLTDSVKISSDIGRINQYLEFASKLGLTNLDREFHFYPQKDYKHSYANYIVLAPGGGKNKWADMPGKRWPESYYKELIKLLSGYNILLIGGSTDIEINKRIALNMKGVTDLTNTLDFDELYNLINGAKCFVGNDSFLLHLAYATKAISIGIFGPTEAVSVCPGSPNVFFIQSTLECSPCYDANLGLKSKAYNCNSYRCMLELKPEFVADFVLSKLK